MEMLITRKIEGKETTVNYDKEHTENEGSVISHLIIEQMGREEESAFSM
jgi:hypothetical protein